MDWVVDRLKEKSTWVGVTMLLSLLGIHLGDETIMAISQVVTAGAGLAAVIFKEKTV